MKLTVIAYILVALLNISEAEMVGKRPYEMEWSNRTQDAFPPLVDFEDLSGWRTESIQAESRFERTREQQIWGHYVGKLTYRGTGATPEVRILPPQPIAITNEFDAVTIWCYGNNWGWATDPSTPRVQVSALFEDASGQTLSVKLYTVDWKEWFLLHKSLTPDQVDRVRSGAKFTGLLITGGKNAEDRVLYFDNLAVFKQQFPPLAFEPRPRRGIEMFPGQSPGANTGRGNCRSPLDVKPFCPSISLLYSLTTLRCWRGRAMSSFLIIRAWMAG